MYYFAISCGDYDFLFASPFPFQKFQLTIKSLGIIEPLPSTHDKYGYPPKLFDWAFPAVLFKYRRTYLYKVHRLIIPSIGRCAEKDDASFQLTMLSSKNSKYKQYFWKMVGKLEWFSFFFPTNLSGFPFSILGMQEKRTCYCEYQLYKHIISW